MSSKTKFQIIFYSIIGVIVISVFYSYNTYDFIELDKAMDITMRKLAIPILICSFTISIIIYNKYIKQFEKKWFGSNFLNFGKITLRVITLSFALSFISIMGALSLLIISNDILNKNSPYKFSGTVIKAWETKSIKHADKTYIKVREDNSDKIIELKVPQLYPEGSSFSKEMNLGYWGLLYSKS